MQPLIYSATECIIHAVKAELRLKPLARHDIGDLIVDAVSKCVKPLHDMIDAYDFYYGDGSGETFFMGPYLNVLPAVVQKRLPGTTVRQPARMPE